MVRSVAEWVGKTDDQPFPPRVRLRILERYHRCCARCTRPIAVGETFTADHIIAIINGGQNRESNGQPLCTTCNPIKNAEDGRIKKRIASVTKAAFGIRPKSRRPMMGSKASGWKKPFNGPAVRRNR